MARNRGKFEKRLSTNDKEEKGNLERFCKSEKNKKNEKNKNTSEGCTYELIKSKLLVNKKNNGFFFRHFHRSVSNADILASARATLHLRVCTYRISTCSRAKGFVIAEGAFDPRCRTTPSQWPPTILGAEHRPTAVALAIMAVASRRGA